MAIYRQLREASFKPAEISTMTAAYETILLKLHLKRGDDPITELIALKVIEQFDPGEADAKALCARVLEVLHVPEQSTDDQKH
jgi:hypothetical protein